jgi:hypothetical protein
MLRNLDYNDVVGVSEEEFTGRARACLMAQVDPSNFTKSDDEDFAKMERLLDLRPGTLSRDVDSYLQKMECESCGRLLTMYDFVFTGLVDAGHSKSLILHTFTGNKFIVNQPRRIRCSACGFLSTAVAIY